MKERCYNPSRDHYADYGGRGIVVCERWLSSFENFLADMDACPSLKHSIDRHPDNNGNYEPGNCRWATKAEQCANQRSNHLIEIDGVTHHLEEWSRLNGIPASTIVQRINKYRWPERDAVTIPVRSRRASKTPAAATQAASED